MSLSPVNGGDFRFKDMLGQTFSASYISNYAYANASVTLTFESAQSGYFSGTINATGLKPNFAYQIKLAGRPSDVFGSNADDATNERLGYLGRWWRSQPNPANSNDGDYNANKDDPNYIYTGYLIIAFVVTDEQGNLNQSFAGTNSFHVLWRTDQRTPQFGDGTPVPLTIPATAGNAAYDVSLAQRTLNLYGEREPGRADPGTLVMNTAHYKCDFVLGEESFHDSGANAGTWAAAMSALVEFDIVGEPAMTWNGPAPIHYPASLSDTQLNATSEVAGTFAYTPPSGTVLPAGIHTLSVTFTPDDSMHFLTVTKTVAIEVEKGAPELNWPTPHAIALGVSLSAVQLSASANVAGTFVYDPPEGTVLPLGTNSLNVVFTPDDSANYNPATMEVSILIGNPPEIVSGPTATQNPTMTGTAVGFQCSATGDEPLTYVWDFQDGTSADGPLVVHTYTTAGSYRVSVLITDRHKFSRSATLNLVVAHYEPPNPLDVKVSIKLNFVKPAADTITLSGFVPVAVQRPEGGRSVQIDLSEGGNATRAFTLDSKDAYKTKTDSFKLRITDRGAGTSRAKFTGKFKGDLAQIFGNSAGIVKGDQRTLSIVLKVDSYEQSAAQPLVFRGSAKALAGREPKQ